MAFPYTKKALKFSNKIVVNGLVKNHKKVLVTISGLCNKKQKIPSKMKILKDEKKISPRYLENLLHEFFLSSKGFILVAVFVFCYEGKPYLECITE